MKIEFFASIIIVLLMISPEAFSSEQKNSAIKTLDSGLTVLFNKKSWPSVVMVLSVKVGSIYDTKSGISHYLEHMIFEGTEGLKAYEIMQKIENLGGWANAMTGLDFTDYLIKVPKESWKAGAELFFESIFAPSLTQEGVEKERGIIMDEAGNAWNMPDYRLQEALFDAAYKVHPYKRMVIGTEESISSITREDIASYYNRYYKPSNMVLVVLGDIEEKDLISVVGSSEPSKFSKTDIPDVQEEPPQRENREVVLKSPEINDGRMILAYRSAGYASEDAYPLTLLSYALGSGSSSKLYLSMVRNGNAKLVSVSPGVMRDPGLFTVYLTFDDGAEEVKKSLLEEMENLNVTQKDLDRAKAQFKTGMLQLTMGGQLDYLEAIQRAHTYHELGMSLEEYMNEMLQVSLDEISKAADNHFNYYTAVIMVPEEKK
jgi:zinc protease